MKMTPDFNRVRYYADACVRGVFTPNEGIKNISKLLLEENHIPMDEMNSHTPESEIEKNLGTQLWRIEKKIDAIERRFPPTNK